MSEQKHSKRLYPSYVKGKDADGGDDSNAESKQEPRTVSCDDDVTKNASGLTDESESSCTLPGAVAVAGPGIRDGTMSLTGDVADEDATRRAVSDAALRTVSDDTNVDEAATLLSATLVTEPVSARVLRVDPPPHEVPHRLVMSLISQRNHKLFSDYGYQTDYGSYVTTNDGNERRYKALKQADDWFFDELLKRVTDMDDARRSAVGQELLCIRGYFEACRKDFGYKDNYGILTTTKQGNQKRHQINQKALKYTVEKFVIMRAEEPSCPFSLAHACRDECKCPYLATGETNPFQLPVEAKVTRAAIRNRDRFLQPQGDPSSGQRRSTWNAMVKAPKHTLHASHFLVSPESSYVNSTHRTYRTDLSTGRNFVVLPRPRRWTQPAAGWRPPSKPNRTSTPRKLFRAPPERSCIPHLKRQKANMTSKVKLGFEAFEDDFNSAPTSADKVHVRVQQRNGRKCITTVAGLADDLDIKRICKAFKKNFSCNGAVQKDEESGEVIQLSGDQRTNVKEFLVDQEICHADTIVLHGF